MKIYEHKIGKHRIRSQYEDLEQVKDIVKQFVPAVLYHMFKIKDFDPETTELPEIMGVGFKYGDVLLTVFAKGYEILFLDSEGVKAMAKKVPDKEPS